VDKSRLIESDKVALSVARGTLSAEELWILISVARTKDEDDGWCFDVANYTYQLKGVEDDGESTPFLVTLLRYIADDIEESLGDKPHPADEISPP
jgi:hypothetical protein